MRQDTEALVGLNVERHDTPRRSPRASGRGSAPPREVGADWGSVRRLMAKLEERHGRAMRFCYEGRAVAVIHT